MNSSAKLTKEVYTYVSEILGYGGGHSSAVDSVMKKINVRNGLPSHGLVWKLSQQSSSGVY